MQKVAPGYMAMGSAGMGPFGPIEMGGMFTIVKVRDGIRTFEDLGACQHPPSTRAYKSK